MMGLGVALSRKCRPLFWFMLAGFLFVLLSLLAAALGTSAFSSFSTPWRVSAVLMPVAFFVVIGRLCLFLPTGVGIRSDLVLLCGIALGIFASIQMSASWQRKLEHSGPAEVMRFAKKASGCRQVWMVPPRDPAFDRFRLVTGKPIVANWKTHPYKDVEVLEWYERINALDEVYSAQPEQARFERAVEVGSRYGVTHWVLPVGDLQSAVGLSRIHVDKRFAVFSGIGAQKTAGCEP